MKNSNKMKRIIYLVVLLLGLSVYGCQEEERLVFSDASAPAPAQVTITAITPTPGGAIIRYQFPPDKNLLAVKAVYVRNGEVCETKVSHFVDSLEIVGFGDTKTHDVEVYSIGRNEKASEPVLRQFTPLTPSILSTKISLETAFGGVGVVFSDNDAKANLTFVLMADTAGNGVWSHLQTFYAAADRGRFARRDLASKEQKFALYVRDRWDNRSDTLIQLITPLEEMKLPKTGWTDAALPTDSNYPADGDYGLWGLSNAWRGPEEPSLNNYNPYYNSFASAATSPFPQHFTINLGYSAVISRMKLWPRTPSELYAGMAPRLIELWGSDNPPADGSWDNWFLLGKWEVFKPSGYDDTAANKVGTVTAEDQQYFEYNQEYDLVPTDEIPDPYRSVRYIRFKTLNSFASYQTGAIAGYVVITEMALWGLINE
jgi:hypothetical protein